MAKFLAVIFMILIGLSMQVGVMMLGWGVQPKSWWWIVGIGFFGQITAQIITKKLLKEDDE